MAEAYGRWAADPQPSDVHTPAGYSSTPTGPTRRAELHGGGQLLGHVWTDDQQAAGFLPAEEAGPAGVRAQAAVYPILQACYEEDVEAGDLLDPDFFPGFELRI